MTWIDPTSTPYAMALGRRVQEAAKTVLDIGMGETYIGITALELAAVEAEIGVHMTGTTHKPILTYRSCMGEHTVIRHDDGSAHVHVQYPPGHKEPYLVRLPGGGYINILQTFGGIDDDDDYEVGDLDDA